MMGRITNGGFIIRSRALSVAPAGVGLAVSGGRPGGAGPTSGGAGGGARGGGGAAARGTGKPRRGGGGARAVMWVVGSPAVTSRERNALVGVGVGTGDGGGGVQGALAGQ